ncbi:MAG: hypothetical protein KGI25_09335 [Thaumarchaeota archaeon]|nr:hypothetical protein [Nitrososphaerota archaeon]
MVRFLSTMHDPKGKRYTVYYSSVLLVVTGVVIFMTLQIIHQGLLQGAMTFFEGFFSLFMLSRNEIVGKALLAHLSGIASFLKH